MTAHADQRREWIRSRRQRRKVARRARYNRQAVRYIMLMSLLALGWCGFTRLPWTLKHGVEDIVVHGNSVTTVNQVHDAVKAAASLPLYQIDPRKLERQVMALKDVKYAFVRRYAFPRPHVVVEVLEEFPWATFSSDPDGQPESVIAQSGRLIPIKDFPRIVQPPLKIYGPPGLKLTSKTVSQWDSWCNFIAEQTGQPVEFVDLRKPFDVRVQDGDLNLKLGTPDGTLTRRLGRLSSVLTAIEPLKGKLEYVDLGLDNNIPLNVAKKGQGQRTASVGHSI